MTKAKTASTAKRAKAEASAATDTTTKMLGEGMEQFSGFAGMFGDYAETGLKAFSERTAASTDMEIQAGFAKNMFSAYTKEMNAQAELCMSAWRSAAKPFMGFAAK